MADPNWLARRSERLRVTLHARVSAPGSDDCGVTLVNITPEGCCVTTGGTRLNLGAPVLVRLESGEALTGTVRWCDGEKAGLEFAHYLTPERVEYLRREHTTFLAETDWNQRKVQRPVC